MIARSDARRLPLRDASVACVVTSPPYNTDMQYPNEYDDALDWKEYEHDAFEASQEIARVLMPGGRAWVVMQHVVPLVPRARDRKQNAQGAGREARVNLLQLWSLALEDAGLLYRDTVAWVQDAHDSQAAWGSWLRPTAPNLRGGWESILLVYKERWKREAHAPECDVRLHDPCTCARGGYVAPQWLVEDEYEGSWMSLTRNVWHIRTARSKVWPAIFPDELVRRCVLLSTFPGETVLDPFSGSGTTARVADALGRRGVGVDL